MISGACISCKAAPFAHLAEKLCDMCYGSPFWVARRVDKLAAEITGIKAVDTEVKVAGLRFDEGKSRVDLLPPDALLELGKVYEVGTRKYAERNWEKGMAWSKMVGPLMRHLFRWMAGEAIDPEDGQRHTAKIAWNAIALLTYELRGIGENNVQLKKAGDGPSVEKVP